MKKGILILLGMVAALVATMVMPAAAFAATTTDVTGNYGAAALTVMAPGATVFGEFIYGDNVAIGTDGSIAIAAHSQNQPGVHWQVTASDVTTGVNKGYMLTGSTPLSSKLEISKDIGVNYASSDVGLIYTGIGLPGPLAFKAKQTVGNDETVGAYTITITFTGSITGF